MSSITVSLLANILAGEQPYRISRTRGITRALCLLL
jgi:hypothetical protein